MSHFFEHYLKFIIPLDDYKLDAFFFDGTHKVYDVKPLIEKNAYGVFGKLIDKRLFNRAHEDFGGSGVIWNEDIDLACDEVWDKGVEVPSPFKGIMSFEDAYYIWEIKKGTLERDVLTGKFKYGIDVYQYDDTWVITRKAMEREYGDMERDYYKEVEEYQKKNKKEK